MRITWTSHEGENGSSLVIALMVLIILTLLGISATTSTDLELKIAANERNYKIAFFHADMGPYITPKLISPCIDDDRQIDAPALTYLDSGTSDFYREIVGINAYDTGKDIEYEVDNNIVQVDVRRIGAESVAGGAVEFASGSQGIGGGTAGSIALLFDLDATGEGPQSSQASVAAVYRKMLGIPGGL